MPRRTAPVRAGTPTVRERPPSGARGAVSPALGNQVIINAFIVVVVGGLGSFAGAFVGAYVIGILIAVGSIVIAGAGQLLPFLVMIAVLILKPEGLFETGGA